MLYLMKFSCYLRKNGDVPINVGNNNGMKFLKSSGPMVVLFLSKCLGLGLEPGITCGEGEQALSCNPTSQYKVILVLLEVLSPKFWILAHAHYLVYVAVIIVLLSSSLL